MSQQAIHHAGLHANRLNHPCGAREETFAKAWRKENEPPSFLNGGRGILDHLLYASQDGRSIDGEATEREESVAATVIQWLGTNCGWSFLEGIIKDCGFVIQQVNLKRSDPPPAERSAFDAGASAMRDAIISAIQRDQAWVDTGKIREVKQPEFGRRW